MRPFSPGEYDSRAAPPLPPQHHLLLPRGGGMEVDGDNVRCDRYPNLRQRLAGDPSDVGDAYFEDVSVHSPSPFAHPGVVMGVWKT